MASTERSRCDVCRRLILAAAALLLIPCFSTPALASRPCIAVAPLAHEVPNLRMGLAAILATEIQASGIADAVGPEITAGRLSDAGVSPADWRTLAPDMLIKLAESAGADYLLAGEITAFTQTARDVDYPLGGQFRDLARFTGSGDREAQVLLTLRLLRLSDGVELGRFEAEGIESRFGERLRSLSLGWLAGTDFGGDDFRQTMLGRAMYKATGEALRRCAEFVPPQAAVLAVSGDSVVLDLGSLSGLAVGDELNVLREESVLSNDGTAVWTDELRVGSLQVIGLQPQRALCLVLDGAGAITEGDVVRPPATRIRLPEESDETG